MAPVMTPTAGESTTSGTWLTRSAPPAYCNQVKWHSRDRQEEFSPCGDLLSCRSFHICLKL